MTPQEILIQARALIESPTRWTQLAYARKEDGSKCPATSALACQWCSAGAVQRIALLNGVSSAMAMGYLNRAAEDAIPGCDAITINDRGGHAVVMEVFNNAIGEAA